MNSAVYRSLLMFFSVLFLSGSMGCSGSTVPGCALDQDCPPGQYCTPGGVCAVRPDGGDGGDVADGISDGSDGSDGGDGNDGAQADGPAVDGGHVVIPKGMYDETAGSSQAGPYTVHFVQGSSAGAPMYFRNGFVVHRGTVMIK